MNENVKTTCNLNLFVSKINECPLFETSFDEVGHACLLIICIQHRLCCSLTYMKNIGINSISIEIFQMKYNVL